MNYQENTNVTTKTNEAINLVKDYYSNPENVSISCIFNDSNVALVMAETDCKALHIVMFEDDATYCPFKPIKVCYKTPVDNVILFATWLSAHYGPCARYEGTPTLSSVDGLLIDNDEMLVRFRTISDVSVHQAYLRTCPGWETPIVDTKLIFTTPCTSVDDASASAAALAITICEMSH